MKKDINYHVNANGLFFGFDFAERSPYKFNYLCFYCNSIYSPDSFEIVCQLDLSVSKLVFDFKCEGINTYYFNIVPAGGSDDGK
ncbi:hypothetical protein [Clostridium beijerinckii]|uniref:hypothetical protein n=1 Tax=Clostridium beijerinckii TaxID=1520 RepID=UPI0003D35606|nr:hypothetical protein [Clostridium beijerinckii]ALB48318.1 hypothetical protein X276_25170 [Clostridium beijerinckii NRRL B-598]